MKKGSTTRRRHLSHARRLPRRRRSRCSTQEDRAQAHRRHRPGFCVGVVSRRQEDSVRRRGVAGDVGVSRARRDGARVPRPPGAGDRDGCRRR